MARQDITAGPTPDRKLALITGVLFVVTFLTSIPAVLLYDPALSDPGWVLGAGGDDGVLLGGFLELLLVAANIGTALALFPVLKRRSEALALGYVAARIVECTFIAIGALCMFTLVTLRADAGAADTQVAHALVTLHDWTFLLGPGFVVGIGNGMLLGWLMWRSGLVPRRMAILGLVGGPLICLSGIAVMFGAAEQGGALQVVATVPEFLWEASLGVYLIAKGFRSPSVRLGRPAVGAPAAVAVA
jgi:hypothetical protein